MNSSTLKLVIILTCFTSIVATTGTPSVIPTGGGNGDGTPGGGDTPGGGAGNGGLGIPAPTLISCAAQNAEGSTLCGHNIQVNGKTGRIEFINNTGKSAGGTSKFVLDDGKFKITDADGLTAGGVAKGGGSTLATSKTSGTYDHVLVFDQNYTADGVKHDITGITGNITKSADLPSDRSLTLSGEAYAAVAQGTKGTDLSSGTATIIADFAAGKVNLTMNGFTATDQASGKATVADLDTISATGMTLSGSGFSGGTISTSLAGKDVDILGANSSKSAAGHFYGSDSGKPDEAAGLVLLKGDSGLVTGVFITD